MEPTRTITSLLFRGILYLVAVFTVFMLCEIVSLFFCMDNNIYVVELYARERTFNSCLKSLAKKKLLVFSFRLRAQYNSIEFEWISKRFLYLFFSAHTTAGLIYVASIILATKSYQTTNSRNCAYITKMNS